MNGKKEFLGKRMRWITDPPMVSIAIDMEKYFFFILQKFAVPPFHQDCR